MLVTDKYTVKFESAEELEELKFLVRMAQNSSRGVLDKKMYIEMHTVFCRVKNHFKGYKMSEELDNFVDEVYAEVDRYNDTGVPTNVIVSDVYDGIDLENAFKDGECAHKIADTCFSIMMSSNFGIGGGDYV